MTEGRVYRYDTHHLTSTQLDPMQDLTAWIAGLRSVGFVSDLLRERHQFRTARATTRAAKAISAHADVAVQFLDQGFAATSEIAFLPVFYALSNLAKITITMSGHLNLLEQERWHGATWAGARMFRFRNFWTFSHIKYFSFSSSQKYFINY